MAGAFTPRLLGLQRSHGNAFVSRLVTSLQRQDGPAPEGEFNAEEFIASEVSPGLSVAAVRQIEEHIRARHRQQALDVLVEELTETGEIDPALLRGGRMYYSSAVAGEGAAQPPGYRTDPDTGERVARPTRVRLGRAAFNRGVPWLYSTVIHEYKHVLQFQRPHSTGPLMGQGPQQWLIHRQEVEAYAHEILNSRTTGLFSNPRQMRETWRRLHSEHWIHIGPQGKRVLNDMYVQAHDIAQEAVGPDVQLPFRPLREAAPAAAP